MALLENLDCGSWSIESQIGDGGFRNASISLLPDPGGHEYIGDATRELERLAKIAGCEDCRVIKSVDAQEIKILIRMESRQSLERILASRSLGEADASKIGIDICQALELLAKNDMMHGDIRPENIMLSKDGDYKLDIIDRALMSLLKKDKCKYAAPECDASADLYSLGMVLHRVMSQPGEADFESRIKGSPLLLPANASEGMAAIILKACANDSSQRYQSASEMKFDLERLAGLVKIEWKDYQPSVKELVFKDKKLSESDLVQLRRFSGLVSLKLTGCQIDDIQPLSELQDLVELDLSKNNIKDLSPLAGLKNLVELDLSENCVKDLSPISELHSLANLYLSKNSITDLRPLAELHSLKNLDLSENHIEDLAPLAGLENLVELILSNNSIVDLGPIANLQNLAILELPQNPIKDLSPLSELGKLVELYLPFEEIPSFAPLYNLKKLNYLGHIKVNEVQGGTLELALPHCEISSEPAGF